MFVQIYYLFKLLLFVPAVINNVQLYLAIGKTFVAIACSKLTKKLIKLKLCFPVNTKVLGHITPTHRFFSTADMKTN